jgi:hypothetical protein
MFLAIAVTCAICALASTLAEARSTSVVNKFKAANSCPATGKVQKTCLGYVVDHIQPLCSGGADTVANLQWQTLKDSYAKDGRERALCNCLKKQVAQPSRVCQWKP